MYVIGITGLSCCGKTTLSENLCDLLGKRCLFLSMDDYYKELTEEQSKQLYDDAALINFDEPNAINFELLILHLTTILNGEKITVPKFDLGSCVVTKYVDIDSTDYDFVVIEGVFIFCDEKLSSLCNLKIWVETSEYVCALRRFIKYTRDIEGYSPDYIYAQCIKFVIPGQEKYIKPSKAQCDIFYNGEKDNKRHIDMIVYMVKEENKRLLENS